MTGPELLTVQLFTRSLAERGHKLGVVKLMRTPIAPIAPPWRAPARTASEEEPARVGESVLHVQMTCAKCRQTLLCPVPTSHLVWSFGDDRCPR